MKKIILICALLFFSSTCFGKELKVMATAYCPCKKCCGKNAKGLTATGEKVFVGVIAVDPKVIPLRSVVKINKKKYYALDTGSAIKGNRVDIFFLTHKEAIKFGRKRVTINF